MKEDSKDTALSNVVRIDDERIKDHLGKMVRSSVEETLNALLDEEADRLCNAGRYERTQARKDFRSGSYSQQAADEGWGSDAEGPEAAAPGVRDGHH